MMKMINSKVIVLALALVLAFALAACNNGGGGAGDSADTGNAAEETAGTEAAVNTDGGTDAEAAPDSGDGGAAAGGEAYALYNKASEAMKGAEGYEMDMVLKTNAGGVSSDSTSHVAVNDPSGKLEMKTTQSLDVSGTKMETVTYVKDGAIYTETAGQKIKMDMDISALAAQTENWATFPEDAIIDQKVEDSDGGKLVSFTVKGESLADYINKQLGGAASGAGEDSGAGLGMTFGEVKISALIGSDGLFKSTTTEMSYSMKIAEKETTASVVTEMKNIKTGKVAIDFPTDLDSYQDFSDALDSLQDGALDSLQEQQ